MSFNSNDDRPPIAEDVPTMRSVMIGSAVPAMPLRRSFPVQDNDKASTKLRVSALPYDGAPSKDASPRWNVTAALKVPSYYEFERTHTRIKGLSASEISRRIDDCLRAESIAATFDNEQAVARAVCSQCVKFVVRLWDCQDSIMVEVQRSSGCSFGFQQLAKKILMAADPTRKAVGQRAPPPLPRSLPPIPDAEWQANACEGVKDAANTLQTSERLDARLLAIESLVHLSETCKCKRVCADAVLQSEGPIFSSIFSLILCSSKNRNAFVDETEALMHRHALNLLANCLEILQDSDDLVATLERLPELTSDDCLDALLRELDVERPHDAAASCRCLAVLIAGCPDLKTRALSRGARDAAGSVSRCRHATLEVESAKLKEIL